MRRALFLSLLALGYLAPYCLVGAAPDSRANRRLLIESERIIFLGDSITYSGEYISNFETWLKALYPKREFDVINLGLPSETLSGLSEPNHAKGKFPRPELFSRLNSVLEKSKPSLIFACYGMNCGVYQPFDKKRFSAYKQGVERLKTHAERAQSKIVFITSAPFDPHGKAHPYVEVLDKYSDWLVSRRSDGWMVIDLHSHMQSSLDLARRKNPQFTYQTDRVHPHSAGHWVMTQPILKWFGDTPSAQATSLTEVISSHKLPAAISPLINKRMVLKRDAWLSYTGHQRPGITKGLPLKIADKKSKHLTREIKRLVKLAGQ